MVRIVLMGTPEFAVTILRALCETHEVVGVFTRPDQPAGRGRQLMLSRVKQEALARGLPIFQPKTLRSAKAQDELRALQPELIVVAAYGLILPQAVLDIPIHGCINVHASLLPKYRGASPIAFALLSGEQQTGITLMLMNAGLDTGPILAHRAIAIAESDTTGTLEKKLSALGAELLIETLPHWLHGDITPQPQDDTRATLTRLLTKEDGLIEWSSSATEIVRRVRAFNPWPTAYTFWRAQPLKILRARANEATIMRGCVVRQDGAVLVGAGEGSVRLDEVQPAGKRAMSAADFVRGRPEFIGARLGEAPQETRD